MCLTGKKTISFLQIDTTQWWLFTWLVKIQILDFGNAGLRHANVAPPAENLFVKYVTVVTSTLTDSHNNLHTHFSIGHAKQVLRIPRSLKPSIICHISHSQLLSLLVMKKIVPYTKASNSLRWPCRLNPVWRLVVLTKF